MANSQINEKLKIVFVGTPEFGATILEGLCQAKYKPALVVTAPDKPVGRKQTITPPPVKILGERCQIKVRQPEKILNLKSEILNLKPDLVVVAAYGQLIPKEILDTPKYGCLNVHPSLLPKYRGPSPIQAAILNGEQETGVTIMLTEEKMDAGPIVANEKLEMKNEKLTYQELHDKLADLGAKLLIETIPKWLRGEIKPKPQEESRATYSKILKREDGQIDWRKTPQEIERQIRALTPWPGTYTIYHGQRLKILKAEVSDNKLITKEVQLEGKKPMSFKDFLRGHPDFKKLC
jgi:methionyl-tRNA formyltransferase